MLSIFGTHKYLLKVIWIGVPMIRLIADSPLLFYSEPGDVWNDRIDTGKRVRASIGGAGLSRSHRSGEPGILIPRTITLRHCARGQKKGLFLPGAELRYPGHILAARKDTGAI